MRAVLFLFTLTLTGGVACAAQIEQFDSPRLAELSRRIDTGDADALKDFWSSIGGTTPLIEPIPNEPHSSRVTFLYEGDEKTQRMGMIGGPQTDVWRASLTRLGGTQLWYRTVRIPSDARFAYWFEPNWPVDRPRDDAAYNALKKEFPPVPDPRNPRHPKWPPNALIAELPEAPPEPWLKRQPDVARGKVEIHDLTSAILRETRFWPLTTAQRRRVDVYSPPGFDPTAAEAYPLLILFDGNGYADDGDLPLAIILDNLIAEKKIPPLVAAFVCQTARRDKELACSELFADFTAKEVVPWMRTHAHATNDPARTIIGGLSYGGLMSAFCAYRHPAVFGSVLCMSGSFQWFPHIDDSQIPRDDLVTEGWLPTQFVTAPLHSTRFYLAAGTFETFFPYSLLNEKRRFRDILLSKGYDVRYREFTGGHDPTGWRGPFVEGVITLLSRR